MAIRVDSALRALLSSAVTPAEWTAALDAALGSAKRIRCFHTVDGITTEFRNVALSDVTTASSTALTLSGKASGTLVSSAADLTQGTATLRIEGGGYWIEGSLGLSGTDFIVAGNFTANNGFAIGAITISPPAGLTTVSVNLVPATFTIVNWTDPQNPVTVGTLTFDAPDQDLVLTDAEIAAEMGTVKVTKSSQSIVYGAFEFGALLLEMDASKNAEASVPLYQVVVNCRPYGTTWAVKYPSYTGYDSANDVTFPNPFKGLLKTAGGTTLHVFEQRDGLPVNSPLMAQFRDTSNALRPHFNCAQMLVWESHQPKISSKAQKFFNGMTPDILRPSTCKESASANARIVLGTNDQQNGALHWYGLSQWPLPRGANNANDYPDYVDPYLYDADINSGNTINQENRTSGWDYEIGSLSGHDRFTGPGGVRPERCAFPPALTAYMTDPAGVRLKGNVPYKDMMHAWNKGYFNQARHFFTDVKTFATIPQEEVVQSKWSHCISYYNGATSGLVADRDKHIPLFARATATKIVDKNGRMPWNGDAVDYQHAYAQSGWGALINNSPMYLITHKQYVFSTILSWLGGSYSATGFPDYKPRFLTRYDAWHWLAMTLGWKLASNHPTLGISRDVILQRIHYAMRGLVESVYKPSLTTTTPYFDAIRNLGVVTTVITSNGTHYLRDGSSLQFYMASVFALMKQTGLWDYLWNFSTDYRNAMIFWVGCYDKYSIDWILDTDGRFDYYTQVTATVPTTEPHVVPSGWAAWATTIRPKTGVEDWITSADGTPIRERDATSHLRAQWAFMRRDFDLYVPNERIAAGVTKYQGFYDTMANRITATTGARAQSGKDWVYRWPGHGLLQAPPVQA